MLNISNAPLKFTSMTCKDNFDLPCRMERCISNCKTVTLFCKSKLLISIFLMFYIILNFFEYISVYSKFQMETQNVAACMGIIIILLRNLANVDLNNHVYSVWQLILSAIKVDVNALRICRLV